MFSHPVDGQLPAFSPEMQAPFHSGLPSEPDHWLQGTSVNEPVSAPWPEGKKTAAPPVSSQMSKLS